MIDRPSKDKQLIESSNSARLFGYMKEINVKAIDNLCGQRYNPLFFVCLGIFFIVFKL